LAREAINGKPKSERKNATRAEGIVSKKLDAPYKPGPSKAWLKNKNPGDGWNVLKIKCHQEESWLKPRMTLLWQSLALPDYSRTVPFVGDLVSPFIHVVCSAAMARVCPLPRSEIGLFTIGSVPHSRHRH